MKHVDLNGKEIEVSSVNGKYYVMDDSCGHMNALLSRETLSNNNIITSPFYGAKFDMTNGKKVGEPVLTSSQKMEPLPQTWQTFFENVGQLTAHIKTYDQKKYETLVDGYSIEVKL